MQKFVKRKINVGDILTIREVLHDDCEIGPVERLEVLTLIEAYNPQRHPYMQIKGLEGWFRFAVRASYHFDAGALFLSRVNFRADHPHYNPKLKPAEYMLEPEKEKSDDKC